MLLIQKRLCSSLVLIGLFLSILLSGSLFLSKLFLWLFLSIALFEFWSLESLKVFSPAFFLTSVSGFLCLSVDMQVLPVLFLLSALLFFMMNLMQKETLQHNQILLFKKFFIFFYLFSFGSLVLAIQEYSHGMYWLLWGIITVKMGDIGAYLIGSQFGRKKIAPSISPQKTWEGALANFVFSIFFGLGLWICLKSHIDGTFQAIFLLICVMNILGQCGDFFESLFKRNGQSNHSGCVIPGIGGVMDLFDSLIFSLPILYLFLNGNLS